MSSAEPEATEAGSAPRSALTERLIDTVEVVLEAHIGKARLTVAELGALRPGASIALDAALDHAVELRLNGATIARGELVAIGDNFGVRLIEIAE